MISQAIMAEGEVIDVFSAAGLKRPDISTRLERIILRLLAKQPDDRYPSAKALLEELEAIRDPEKRTSTLSASRTRLDAILVPT